jgi:hypothetical protein
MISSDGVIGHPHELIPSPMSTLLAPKIIFLDRNSLVVVIVCMLKPLLVLTGQHGPIGKIKSRPKAA